MNIAIIGCGKMIRALILPFKEDTQDFHFFYYSKGLLSAEKLSQEVKGTFIKDLQEYKNYKIDLWLLGMKPQSLKDFSSAFKKLNLKDQNFISILAGVKTSTLKKELLAKAVFRAMPNIASEFKNGVTLLYSSDESPLSSAVKRFFSYSSAVFEMSERELEIATVLSGSGPAFFYFFTKTLEEAISRLGLSSKTSKDLARLTFLSAASVLKHSSLELDALIDTVSSKGGVTVEGIKSFKENNLEELSSKALLSALKRGDELSRGPF